VSVAIINYGMGNLASVRKALEDLGAHAFIADAPAQLEAAERAVLPGVGAFGEAMQRLHESAWPAALGALVGQGRPLLGICLGMQLLASTGEEGGETPGLGLIAGRVRRLDDLGCRLRIPHVGWNDIAPVGSDALLAHVAQGADFYFVHSFAFVPVDAAVVVARASYGVPIAAAVRCGAVMGTQFHPEKSSRAGRQLLRNFLDLPRC
jgi:imidazole glycerol-phosphate synthase subunit HisH